MNSSLRESQARFFDSNPPLYPWPHLLRGYGLRRLYKPREAFWAQAMRELGLEEGTKVLDLGCGTGIWLERLANEFGIHGIGVDVSQGSLVTAKSETSYHCRFALADGYSLPFATDEFDCLLSLDTLEHVSDQTVFLCEISRVLKPEGRVFLWSINKRQKYTWNWLLARIGFDIFDRVAHDPTLIPDPVKVVSQLERDGITVMRCEYFNAFFSLALDEAIMFLASMLKRLGLFEPDGGSRELIGRLFLAISHVATGLLWRILNRMDGPWQAKGVSNGFLVTGTKTAHGVTDVSSGQGKLTKARVVPPRPLTSVEPAGLGVDTR